MEELGEGSLQFKAVFFNKKEKNSFLVMKAE